jgi:phosphatidylinositol glycan class V
MNRNGPLVGGWPGSLDFLLKVGYYLDFIYLCWYFKDLREVGFDYQFVESIVGITISHASHGFSVLVLYSLGTSVFHSSSGRKISFIAACLHIITPGGLFLSSPNGEATFSLLTFSGCFFFVQSFRLSPLNKDLAMVVAGLLFAVSATVRSNGLTYGFLFAEEAARVVYSVRDGLSMYLGLSAINQMRFQHRRISYFPPRGHHLKTDADIYTSGLAIIRRLAATGLGGLAIAVGFLLPQYIAYQDLCGETPSVWCSNALPSVYSYVQDHY